MGYTDKTIGLSAHALGYAASRGFSEDEVRTAIQKAVWNQADQGRLECRWNFDFNRSWNGRPYQTKQLRPVFVEESDRIVVVTVYTYYF